MSNLYAEGIKIRTKDQQVGDYVNIEKVILTQKQKAKATYKRIDNEDFE